MTDTHKSHLAPVTLRGNLVQLEPLTMAHWPDLCEAGLDPELWRWTPMNIDTRERMRSYIEDALKAQEQGTALPFATIEKNSGKAIGSTRFGNIDPSNGRVEIGWTWISPDWQRTPINTEAKFLMLCHAFESLGCIRVEFKTDSLNERSRVAILRLGAVEEGTLRNHMITYNGRIRNTVYFSIINTDWPQLKTRLENRLRRPFEKNRSSLRERYHK